jgi:hypothetical protein
VQRIAAAALLANTLTRLVQKFVAIVALGNTPTQLLHWTAGNVFQAITLESVQVFATVAQMEKL